MSPVQRTDDPRRIEASKRPNRDILRGLQPPQMDVPRYKQCSVQEHSKSEDETDSIFHEFPLQSGTSSSTPQKSSSIPKSRGPKTFSDSVRRKTGAALYPMTRTRCP